MNRFRPVDRAVAHRSRTRRFIASSAFAMLAAASVIPASAYEITVEKVRDARSAAPDSAASASQAEEPSRPGQIPLSRIANGTGFVRAAWLAGPTERYDHGILGDRIEASRLSVETADGRLRAFDLPANRVFEDLVPRLSDLDGDGTDEIIVVETDLELGASLSVFRIEGSGLARWLQTPFLGRPHRWLNPLGVGDFDGDGAPDIALVTTPHIGGVLRLYGLPPPGSRSASLLEYASLPGISTHSIGQTELGLGTVVRMDGRDLILAPDQAHSRMLLVAYEPDALRVLAEAALPSPIVTSLEPSPAFAGTDTLPTAPAEFVFSTADGTRRRLSVR